jgi:hypothetical protein
MLTPSRAAVLREGIVVGLIGAGCLAAWFLIVDIIAGRPFFTPAVLGSVIFFGLDDPETVVIGVKTVAAYTAFHVVAFLIVGVIASTLVANAKRSPNAIWLFIEFFIVFQIGFYAAQALVFTPLLAALAWINVILGNVIAAVAMGYYMWRAHPELHAALTFRDPDFPDGGADPT